MILFATKETRPLQTIHMDIFFLIGYRVFILQVVALKEIKSTISY